MLEKVGNILHTLGPWALYSLPVLGQSGFAVGPSKSSSTLNTDRFAHPFQDPSFYSDRHPEDDAAPNESKKKKKQWHSHPLLAAGVDHFPDAVDEGVVSNTSRS